MKINIFTPPKFEHHTLDLDFLNQVTNKNWQYTSSGRASLYHILKSIDTDKILIPVYICETVLEPLKKLNITPIFYDLDIDDLNPSFESIKYLSQKYDVKAVLVASMYGNAANLLEIESYCKDNNIFMIDDAAQSFGAKLNDRYVGTFGDAGFFSFSPGKPTAGHMGSFFWSKNMIEIKRTNHCTSHYIKWLVFYFNRYKIDNQFCLFFLGKPLSYLFRIVNKFIDMTYDDICTFEANILGGILYSNINGIFDFRNKFFDDFHELFYKKHKFRVITAIRGTQANHKIVVVFNNKFNAEKFIKYMFDNKIFVMKGYSLLSDDLDNLPNASAINGCVIEIPIEDDIDKMNYIFGKV